MPELSVTLEAERLAPHEVALRARLRLRPVAISLVASLMLSACAQVQQMTGTENCDDPALTPSQQLLCHDDKKFHQTIVGGAVIGTLVGAAGGAATCALSGRKNILLCAGIGAGVGLFAGGVAGYVVAKQQAAATSHVRAIDGVTDDIRAENIALQKEVDAAQDVSTQDQAKLAQINAAVASGQLSADAARSQRSIIAQDSAHIQTIIDHLQQQQKNFAEAGQKINQPSRSYTKQMNELQDQIATLTQQKAALDQAMAASA